MHSVMSLVHPSCISFLLLSSVLTGCMVGPNYVRPEIPMPDSFVDGEQLETSTDEVQHGWWKQFQDSILNDLVQRTIESNKDLEIALSRVNQARAIRREAVLSLLPEGSPRLEYNRQRMPGIRFGDIATDAIEFESYTAGFDAFWEIDILGRSRRNIEARSAERDAAIANLEDVIRILIADVARAYFELRGAQRQLDVAEKNVVNQDEVLQMVKNRKEAGVGTELEEIQAEALLTNTKASIPPLEATVKQRMNQIAVLLGEQPEPIRTVLSARSPLPKYVGPLQLGNPSELLRRRPDVRAAERMLAASVASIGIATGNLFPRASISGNIYLEAVSPNEWGEAHTKGFGIGPRIEWAAFDLAKVYAQIDRADEVSREALSAYEKTVLTALEETSSALAALSAARERVEHLRRSLDLYERSVEHSLIGHQEGAVDYLTVLESQRSLFATEAEVVRSEIDYSTSIVALYKALGAGWGEIEIAETTEKSLM